MQHLSGLYREISTVRTKANFMKSRFLRFLLLICSPSVFSQELDSTNWFPHKTGDMWEYYVVEGINTVTDTAQIINVRDSLAADGTIHLTQHFRFINPVVHDPFIHVYEHRIDTVNGEVIGPSGELRDVPIYHFNVQQGDQWVMYDHNGPPGAFTYEMARVIETYDGIAFGHNTSFIEMRYYVAPDSTDTTGLDRIYRTLARGFGLVFEGGGESFYHFYLKGAVINGVLYGDTTNVVTSVDSREYLPPQAILHQNYPNPFNPATMIRFGLNVAGDVSLVVYDPIGREIRKLIDHQRLEAGDYRILWDGRTDSGAIVTSGVYYYRLIAGGTMFSRSMILLK